MSGQVVQLPTWEDKVKNEAMKFAEVVRHNFANGLQLTLAFLPDSTPTNKMRQLDIFIDALIGAAVQIPCVFAGYHEELHNAILEGASAKLDYIRDLEAKRKAEEP